MKDYAKKSNAKRKIVALLLAVAMVIPTVSSVFAESDAPEEGSVTGIETVADDANAEEVEEEESKTKPSRKVSIGLSGYDLEEMGGDELLALIEDGLEGQDLLEVLRELFSRKDIELFQKAVSAVDEIQAKSVIDLIDEEEMMEWARFLGLDEEEEIKDEEEEIKDEEEAEEKLNLPYPASTHPVPPPMQYPNNLLRQSARVFGISPMSMVDSDYNSGVADKEPENMGGTVTENVGPFEYEDGPILNKTSTGPDVNGVVELSLNVTATSQTITTYSPVDFILVLDRSLSMKWTNDNSCKVTVYEDTVVPTKKTINIESGTHYHSIFSWPNHKETVDGGWTGSYAIKVDGKTYPLTPITQSDKVYTWDCGESKTYNYVSNVWKYTDDDNVVHYVSFENNRNNLYTFTGAPYNVNQVELNHTFYRPKQIDIIDILVPAAQEFVDGIAEHATEHGLNHRVAVTSFAGGSDSGRDELQYYTRNNPSDSRISELVSATQHQSTIKNAIANMQLASATNHNNGLKKANEIMGTTLPTDRKTVVVMFTDGMPVSSGSSFDTATAKDSIATANTIKEKGATIYTIGIFADQSEFNQIHPFMNRMSSNFRYSSLKNNTYNHGNNDQYIFLKDENNQELYTGAPLDEVHGYYHIAADESSLTRIFNEIKQTSTESTSVEGVQVKDYIDERFVPCAADGSLLTNYTVTAMVGSTPIAGTYMQDFDGKWYISWDVSRIDANNPFNAVLYVKPAEHFLGGDNVPTNDSPKSGLYHNGNRYRFPMPLVDYPLIEENVEARIASATKYYLLDETVPSADTMEGEMKKPYTIGENILVEWNWNANSGFRADLNATKPDTGDYTQTLSIKVIKTGQTPVEKSADYKLHVIPPVASADNFYLLKGETISDGYNEAQVKGKFTIAAPTWDAVKTRYPAITQDEYNALVAPFSAAKLNYGNITINNSTYTTSGLGGFRPVNAQTPAEVALIYGSKNMPTNTSFVVYMLTPEVSGKNFYLLPYETVSEAYGSGYDTAKNALTLSITNPGIPAGEFSTLTARLNGTYKSSLTGTGMDTAIATVVLEPLGTKKVSATGISKNGVAIGKADFSFHVAAIRFTDREYDVFLGETINEATGKTLGTVGADVEKNLDVSMFPAGEQAAVETRFSKKDGDQKSYADHIGFIVEPADLVDTATFGEWAPKEDATFTLTPYYRSEGNVLAVFGTGDAEIKKPIVTVKLKSGQLTITKIVEGAVPTTQGFIFEIVSDNGDRFREVIYVEAGDTINSVVITKLPRGTYTVTELDWATSYELVSENDLERTISKGTAVAETTFRNKRHGTNYLNAVAHATNKFKSRTN